MKPSQTLNSKFQTLNKFKFQRFKIRNSFGYLKIGILRLFRISCLGFSIFLLYPQLLEARIYIQIDQPSDQKFPIAIPNLIDLGPERDKNKWHKKLPELLELDMKIAGLFEILPNKLFPKFSNPYSADDIEFDEWSLIGAHALVKGTVETEKDGVSIELRLYDTTMGELLVGHRYKARPGDISLVTHHFADEILKALTGERGPFSTQIAFTSNVHRRYKEIFVVDVDGKNVRQITHAKSLSSSPAWDPTGEKLVYSSYINGYPELIVKNLKTGARQQITNNESITITPDWHPKGGGILASSALGDEVDIHLFHPNSKHRQSLAPAFGIDLNPSWSPDGSEFVFASERSGNLHLFKAKADGTQLKRLTFVGYHNDNPAWSPKGDKIAFQSRDEGNFDIFIMNTDGSMIQRLTALEGNNESPSWAPNGRYIAFSSTRSRKGKKLMIMLGDGSNPIEIPMKINGYHPDWGPWLVK